MSTHPTPTKRHLTTRAWLRGATALAGIGAIVALGASGAVEQTPPRAATGPVDLQAMCTPEGVQAIASTLTTSDVKVRRIEIPPIFANGTRYVPATAALPAYCQVTASFVTNPKTGKTANLLATFPANWNGKYLQLGCSGHCGNFAVSDPSSSVVTITTQGYPGQIMAKGYATFATDEGHLGMDGGAWAIKGPGQVDEDAITDYLYRADKVLAKLGKEFTTAFYGKARGSKQVISRSYFNGCSGGGRDAFVAASYFPEEFDGIIAGSAYNLMGRAFHGAGTALATVRSSDAVVPPSLVKLVDPIVKAQCDQLDGVKDGLIQNPAACNFRPERDLPNCVDDKPGAQCFTKAQIETLSVVLSAVTDESGKVVQPGYSVSELSPEFAPTKPANDPTGENPWSKVSVADGQMWGLADAAIKVFGNGNATDFTTRSIISYGQGGPGQVTAFRAITPRAQVDKAMAAGQLGIGHDPAKADRLIKLDHKFLIWHNWSDEKLTPYMSINYYKQLAKLHGGYANVQKNVRLFMIPGSGHCSMSGVGPNNFDAMTAIENWVEKGQAPDALPAKLYSTNSPAVNWSKTPLASMPLCKFPEMARYSGKGDVKDAKNWSCPAGDKRLLTMGDSGRQAGMQK